jgi:two-component system phosphate regulon response regulator PhoB
MQSSVLIVEDEADIRKLLVLNLQSSGYQVLEADNVSQASGILATVRPSLCILDWMLSDQTGIYLLRKLKADPLLMDIPVIMLTARSSEHDKVMAFDLGADDYVTKPFSPRELIARMGVLLRRTKDLKAGWDSKGNRVLKAGRLQACQDSLTVCAGETVIQLHAIEFRLLAYLLTRPNRVHSRPNLIQQVWGHDALIDERTVDAHVRRVRAHLAALDADCAIQTVRGEGYRLLVVNAPAHQDP